MSNSASGCTGCIYSRTKLTFLGWRSFCNRFRCLRNDRCIDYRQRSHA